MKKYHYFLFCVGLIGCATPEQKAAEKAAADAAYYADLKRKVEQVWGPQCEAIGYEARSDKWKDCVRQLASMDLQRETNALRKEQEDRANMGRALQNFGNAVYGPEATRARQIPQQQPAYQPPVQTFCQPNGVGGFNCTTR